ncbi:hypothetical protein QVD17_32115 [Tagetes erecta]|uniref:Uncharacterized protein n=1 Tax=Tagetes erecta TaxID=13708 RepID=A0AAD8NPV2_TARER|nr:hypothetical protein QVD17_32115 [Tagetes erecta]
MKIILRGTVFMSNSVADRNFRLWKHSPEDHHFPGDPTVGLLSETKCDALGSCSDIEAVVEMMSKLGISKINIPEALNYVTGMDLYDFRCTLFKRLCTVKYQLFFQPRNWGVTVRNLLLELHVPVRTATMVFCDNVSAVYLTGNPVQHQRTKHVELDIHFVREKVQIGQVRVIHVLSSLQYADIFTKGLPRHLFDSFRSSLNVSEYQRSS